MTRKKKENLIRIDPNTAPRPQGKPSQESLDKKREMLAETGVDEKAHPYLQMQDLETQSIIAAQHAMCMYYDRTKQIDAIQKLLKCDKIYASKVHRVVRQLYVLDAHVPDRDQLRNELRSHMYSIWDSAADDLQHDDPKTRAHARGQMINLSRQLALLDGLMIPTKQQIEFSEKKNDQYANVIEAEVKEAKEMLLESGLMEEAKEVTKEKLKKGAKKPKS